MRIGIIALSAVILAVLLSGCLETELKDCGTDAACFAEAIAVCEPAKVIRQEPPGLLYAESITTYMEVRGGTVDSCTFYYKLTDATIPSDATAEERAEIMALIDFDMTCTGPVALMMSGSSDFLNYCEGPLKDFFMELPPLIDPILPSDIIQLSVERCYADDQTLDIRNVGSAMIPAGTVFSIYNMLDASDTGATITLTSSLTSGSMVTVQATRRLSDSTEYFLDASGYLAGSFTC